MENRPSRPPPFSIAPALATVLQDVLMATFVLVALVTVLRQPLSFREVVLACCATALALGDQGDGDDHPRPPVALRAGATLAQLLDQVAVTGLAVGMLS